MPLSKAFLHSKAAESITPGLEVLVQEVIAAITTEPCFNSNSSLLNENLTDSCS